MRGVTKRMPGETACHPMTKRERISRLKNLVSLAEQNQVLLTISRQGPNQLLKAFFERARYGAPT